MQMTDPAVRQDGLVLGIEDHPAHWWQALLFGWQHTLVDISPFVLPLAVTTALGMSASASASLISYGLIAMGITTLIQTTIGNRLPIIQGPSATLIGTLAPVAAQLGAPAMWGGIVIGGIAEGLLGALRLPGLLRRFLPHTVTGTVVVVIGLSLGALAVRLSIGDGSALNFVFAGSVIALVLLFHTAFRHVAGGLLAQASIFLAIWIVGLGLGGALGKVDWALVAASPWFELPKLFPFGGPFDGWSVTVAATTMILVGYLGSAVESLGDYAATCEVSGVTLEDRHMNRGILAEGAGSLLAACLGGLPCTSYTQNIGIIATTRIASRRVVQIAALILMLYGLCPKFGAMLVALPRSVLGGVFVLVCGMIVVSGIGLVARGLAESGDGSSQAPGNGFVVGLTLILALGVPVYLQRELGETFLSQHPQWLTLIVTNPVVLAVLLGITLNLLVNPKG